MSLLSPQDDSFGGQKLPANSLHPARRDPSNKLAHHSENVLLSEDGLGIRAEGQIGWWGARADRGYAVGGAINNKCCYFEVLIDGRGVSRVGFSLRGARYNLGTDDKGFGFGGKI